MRRSKLLLLLVGVCLLTACEKETQNSTSPSTQSASPAGSSTSGNVADRWAGKWWGPEGTYLEIAGNNGTYQITIRNLDGPRTFQGVGRGSRIDFERDGITESIRAGTGAETGMKWLADKSDCLVVKPGEGYCHG